MGGQAAMEGARVVARVAAAVVDVAVAMDVQAAHWHVHTETALRHVKWLR